MMKIVQPLNNNVVMAYDRRQGEIVVVGTGVGFHAKKGDLVDEKKIQKIFVAGQNKKLMELIEQVPPEYLELTEEIFEKAKEAYGVCPQDQETLALMDHIHFAVRRLRDGMEFDNPFVTEIRQFYPKEWEIALYAKERIRERFGVEIPDAEVGYIAMHMIASEFQKDRQTVNRTFKVINLSLDYIREHYYRT